MRRTSGKRFLSTLLAFAMLLGMLPATVFAAEVTDPASAVVGDTYTGTSAPADTDSDGIVWVKSLRSAIEKYIHFYNYERFQERFETRTPMEVRTEALNSRNPAPYPIPENKRIQKYKAKFAA